MIHRLLILLGVFCLAACSSSPTPRFHALQARAEGVSGASSKLAIVVEAVGLPAVVDRRQIVLGTGQVSVEEFDRWAAPLKEDLGRVLALNLSRQLGAPQVSAWPQALISDPDLRVSVDLARFESVPGERGLIEANWIVRDRKNQLLVSGRDIYEAKPVQGNIPALVAAHDETLVRLSAGIARAIRNSLKD